MKMDKTYYLAPEVVCFDIVVEAGFAPSNGGDPNVQDPDENDPMGW